MALLIIGFIFGFATATALRHLISREPHGETVPPQAMATPPPPPEVAAPPTDPIIFREPESPLPPPEPEWMTPELRREGDRLEAEYHRQHFRRVK